MGLLAAFLGKLFIVLGYPVTDPLAANDMRAEYIEPDNVHIDMHIEVQRGTPIEEGNRIAHEVEAHLHADLPGGFCAIPGDPAVDVGEKS